MVKAIVSTVVDYSVGREGACGFPWITRDMAEGRDLVTSKSMLYMFLNKASFAEHSGRPSGGVACGLSSRIAREWKATGRHKRCWGIRIMSLAWGCGQQSGGGVVAYAPDSVKGTESCKAFLEHLASAIRWLDNGVPSGNYAVCIGGNAALFHIDHF